MIIELLSFKSHPVKSGLEIIFILEGSFIHGSECDGGRDPNSELFSVFQIVVRALFCEA